MADEDSRGLSITAVVVLVFLLASFLAWGALATSYTGATSPSSMSGSPRGRRGNLVEGVGTFAAVAVSQLPNCVEVISWHASNRLWLLIAMAAVPAAVIAGGFGMKQLEKSLEGPPKRRRR